MPRVEIRLLKNHEEYAECERLQHEVWGTLGVASEVLSVTQKYGGVVLGSLVNGKVIGFLYAFLAQYRGRLIHWSHMMAVQEGHRDKGLGFRMKLAHRQVALARGIRSICWTYDPLQSRNGALNLRRLGGRVDEYLPNCYGQFESRIEKGLPSDRFVVCWHVGAAHVERRLREEPPPVSLSLPRVNETRATRDGFIENWKSRLGLRELRVLVEIPRNTDEMRARNLPLALLWRMETRRILEHYFRAAYAAVDFIPPSSGTEGRCFYVLKRQRRSSDRPGAHPTLKTDTARRA